MSQEVHTAIVLAAGRGSRMGTDIQKQYLLLKEKPILYYSLAEFQYCPFINEIILVTGAEEIDYCRSEIVERYSLTKVKAVITGGKERFHSVYEGLKMASDSDYVYIHDGARPFVKQDILLRAYKAVRDFQACVVGMPAKDTIKISDQEGYICHTPSRDLTWVIQTPQAFRYHLIKKAYDEFMKQDSKMVTDDAMVLEKMENKKVKLVTGSYENIKITTPEDLAIADLFVGICR